MKIKAGRPVRLFVFDIENKPGTYGPGDYTHPKVTAVGWQFLGEDEPDGLAFNRRSRLSMRRNAERFRALWDAADIVIGHNIRRHDKRLLDGFYTTLDLPLLAHKAMVDTYLDLPRMEGLSRSLENLAGRWESPIPKMQMPEHAWEAAYDGVPEYVERMRQRAITDVQISVWLYHELRRRGLLA